MAISSSETPLEGPVGLFWDYDSAPSLDEHDMSTLIRKIQEFGDVLSGGKGFDVQVLCHHNPKNAEYFRKFGFEVIDQDGESWPALDSGVNSVTAKILMWLWDVQRKAAEHTVGNSDCADQHDDESSVLSAPAKIVKAPTILLLSGNDFLAPFLTSLKQRDVSVFLLSPLAGKPISALHHACSSALDLKQFLQGAVPRRRASDITPQSSQDSVVTEDETEQDAAIEQFINQKDDEDFPEPSPTSMQWSPTPRGKNEQAPPARHVVPPLAISAMLNSARESGESSRENADQGVLPSDQHRRPSLPHNAASRLMKGEEIAMDSPRSLDGYINKDDDNDTVLLQEQRTLHDELVTAIYMNNVKTAVATLRKMYTRQSRSFRIPALLSSIMPDTAAMLEDNQVELFHVSVKFSLDCIQWCFGVQRGENVESFKYKMNKNIARWILKETQRKGLTNPASQYTIGIGVALVKSLLVDTTELEFALDILTCLNVPQPLQYFVPYVTSWMKAPPAFQQHLDLKSLQKFVYEHPELHTIAQRGLPVDLHDQGSASRGSTSSPSLSSQSNTNTSSSGNSYLSMSGRSWDDKGQGAYGMPDARKRDAPREEWIRDSSGSAQQGAREHMLYHLNEYGDKLGGGASGMKQMDRPGYGHSHNSSSQPLESKLLKLLMRSAKGELGARIPALYRDEYGEPLRLRGRKLKDILLETGLVEMVGSDGPGDKLFRIIGNSGSDSALDLGGGQSKDGSHMRGNDAAAIAGYRTQTRAFENSQMSRDGGMDSYRSSVQRNDRPEAGGMDHRRPYVPSLLSEDYPGGLNSFVKNREGGGESFSSQEYGSAGRRHNEDVYGSRLPMQTQQPQHYQSAQSHQYPRHQQPQQQHQQQSHHHHMQSEMSTNMMYSSYTCNHTEDFSVESRPPRDGGDYVKRLYEERGLSQSSSPFMFESGASLDGGSGAGSVVVDAGGGTGTLSELNMDSLVLGEDRGTFREELPK
mmetsp:Transcript_15142/g.28500  ORF Transcript_15142/g.28500 Transcript_15142/m.28500 type:complete len:981 (+) Transcript_15142:116-3058(+)